LGLSTPGEPTRWRTAPATAFVTDCARERPRMNEPRKPERGDVGLDTATAFAVDIKTLRAAGGEPGGVGMPCRAVAGLDIVLGGGNEE